MPSFGKAFFIALNGSTPPRLGLRPLSTTEPTRRVIEQAFVPFLNEGVRVQTVQDLFSVAEEVQNEPALVYLMGHAWLEAGDYLTATNARAVDRVLNGEQLLIFLAPLLTAGGLLIVDTCHAAALRRNLILSSHPGLTVIFASAENEAALEFPADGATRFSITLRKVLDRPRRPANPVDTIAMAIAINEEINRPNLVAPQTVEYWVAGTAFILSPSSLNKQLVGKRTASRTYLVVRSGLLALGAIAAVLLIILLVYYRNHFQLELAVDKGERWTASGTLSIRRQNPETNLDEEIANLPLRPSAVLRTRLPTDDLLLVVNASYEDHYPRALNFHLKPEAGFSVHTKFVRLSLPSPASIQIHPNMAFVPTGSWLQGADKKAELNRSGFWIDLYPVTVHEYLPVARTAVGNGTLEDYNSFLLTKISQASAIKATGLTQAPKLLGDLGKIFDVIDAEKRAAREPSEGKPLPEGTVPCADCPAPMTMIEANLYCKSRGMRLPTALEWELAARGVDGRLYPWGNRFEADRANIIGLPDKGQRSDLQSVKTFPRGRSPFGLFDMVGNAGDWVDTNGGYERTFMGGTYRFNKEDSLTYSTMPDTGDPLPYLPVTCRCVSNQ
jgi:hypothetical protein